MFEYSTINFETWFGIQMHNENVFQSNGESCKRVPGPLINHFILKDADQLQFHPKGEYF